VNNSIKNRAPESSSWLGSWDLIKSLYPAVKQI
jgi:hypothetical protein